MKVIVFGATGKTGQHVCRLALERGHEVTAFTRSAGRLNLQESGLRAAQGDVMDPDSVAAAIADHDAVIVALGSNGLRDKATLAVGTGAIIEGMERHNVGRLIVLSAAGVGSSWNQVSLMARFAFRTFLRNIYADHEAQEAKVAGSSLDWTIVRAAILKDNPASGRYQASNMGKVTQISREDVADFLVKQVEDNTYRRQAVSVTW